MGKTRLKLALGLFAAVVTGAIAIYAFFGHAVSGGGFGGGGRDLYYYTSISGLPPASTIEYEVTYEPLFLKHYKDENGDLPPVVTGTVTASAEGVALLPEMRTIYDRYRIRMRAQDGHSADLDISRNDETGRLNIAGKGFETFSDVFMQDIDGAARQKTDWAGVFAQSLLPQPNDQGGQTVRVAFRNFTVDGIENPAMLDVVIGVGGGPTSAQVNVYDPVIHDYNCDQPRNGVNGESVFYVSTCDQSRVARIVEGTGTGTITYNLVQPMMKMGEQLSAVMMQQMQILGGFMDAQEQMETQRDVRSLVAQAHKDYQPSEQMCFFGSSMRSLSESQQGSEYTKQAFDSIMKGYTQFHAGSSTSEGYVTDIKARLAQFKATYCDPNDSDGGLWEMCRGRTNDASVPSSGTAAVRDRFNKDVDYYRTFERPLTLELDLTNTVITQDEEDMIALARNLYWPRAPHMANRADYENSFRDNYSLFLKARSITAKYNVAYNSFVTIAGLKSNARSALGATAGASYMKTMLLDMGYTEEDIEDVMGANPSYYAQMEFLTKKMYQNPNFYTSLYDKPANVERMGVTLKSFGLMQNRDLHESQMRQELLISLMVEQKIAKMADDVNARVGALATNTPPRRPD